MANYDGYNSTSNSFDSDDPYHRGIQVIPIPAPVSDDGFTVIDEVLNQVESLKDQVETLKEHVAVLSTAYMQLSTSVNKLPVVFRDIIGTNLSLVPPLHPPAYLPPPTSHSAPRIFQKERRHPSPAAQLPHPPYTPSAALLSPGRRPPSPLYIF